MRPAFPEQAQMKKYLDYVIVSPDDPVALDGGLGLDVDVGRGADVVLAGAVGGVPDPTTA